MLLNDLSCKPNFSEPIALLNSTPKDEQIQQRLTKQVLSILFTGQKINKRTPFNFIKRTRK